MNKDNNSNKNTSTTFGWISIAFYTLSILLGGNGFYWGSIARLCGTIMLMGTLIVLVIASFRKTPDREKGWKLFGIAFVGMLVSGLIKYF